MKTYFIVSEPEEYKTYSKFFSGNNIKATPFTLSRVDDCTTLYENAIGEVAAAFGQLPAEEKEAGVQILSLKQNETSCELCVYDGTTYTQFTNKASSDWKRPLSEYVLKFHSYEIKDLSIRKDYAELANYVEDGTVGLRSNPQAWILRNNMFKMLDKVLYQKLVAFTLNERGMFPKVWSLNRQKNYWNASLNGGLPIVKKRDEVHEGTFMLHDMFHFVFRDPIVTGRETIEEKRCFIAYRMMSEGCTLVLADMLSIYLGKLKDTGYDTSARQVYPLFESLNIDLNKVEDLCRLLHANCTYCLFGDDSEYRAMGADEAALKLYKDKYSIFFTVDFKWNKKNIENMLQSIEEQPALKDYFDSLPGEVASFNTHSLYEQIVNEDGTLSMDKLFSIFWQQLMQVFYYSPDPYDYAYTRGALLDYISGQIRIAYMYPEYAESEVLKKKFSEFVAAVRLAKHTEELLSIYDRIRTEINNFIDVLEKDGKILPHERVVFRLHIPHFVPIFYSYDKPRDQYVPLEVQSAEIFEGTFISSAETFDNLLKKVSEEDQANYKESITKTIK